MSASSWVRALVGSATSAVAALQAGLALAVWALFTAGLTLAAMSLRVLSFDVGVGALVAAGAIVAAGLALGGAATTVLVVRHLPRRAQPDQGSRYR